MIVKEGDREQMDDSRFCAIVAERKQAAVRRNESREIDGWLEVDFRFRQISRADVAVVNSS